MYTLGIYYVSVHNGSHTPNSLCSVFPVISRAFNYSKSRDSISRAYSFQRKTLETFIFVFALHSPTYTYMCIFVPNAFALSSTFGIQNKICVRTDCMLILLAYMCEALNFKCRITLVGVIQRETITVAYARFAYINKTRAHYLELPENEKCSE